MVSFFSVASVLKCCIKLFTKLGKLSDLALSSVSKNGGFLFHFLGVLAIFWGF